MRNLVATLLALSACGFFPELDLSPEPRQHDDVATCGQVGGDLAEDTPGAVDILVDPPVFEDVTCQPSSLEGVTAIAMVGGHADSLLAADGTGVLDRITVGTVRPIMMRFDKNGETLAVAIGHIPLCGGVTDSTLCSTTIVWDTGVATADEVALLPEPQVGGPGCQDGPADAEGWAKSEMTAGGWDFDTDDNGTSNLDQACAEAL